MKKKNLQTVILTAMFIATTIAFQMLGMHQFVTGPIVNAMLILSALFTGVFGGVFVGVITPWIALLRGVLKAPLAPMIPFIMIGNAAFVISFYICRISFENKQIGSIVGIIAGSITKFLFLSAAVRFLVQVPPPIAQAMQIPQLITALVGGALAMAVSKLISASGKREEMF